MELYVHIPFCVRKCRYCSFVSYAAKEADHEAYVNLLLKEAAARAGEAEEPVRTVYIGGGTPSLLSPSLFRKMSEGLRGIFGFDEVGEFTTEANPGTVTKEWLDAAADAGVSRISFGMQALQEKTLKVLGRIHRFEDVVSSVQLARSFGIGNISLDLMFGIPGQTMDDWKETLSAALSLGPEHLSAYGLIPEEGTPLYGDLENGSLSLPEPEAEREMYAEAVQTLHSRGYERYEISNFARPGYECRHNIGYWTQVPYIGLGISAASMVSVRRGSGGMTYLRKTNPSSAEAYGRLIGSDPSSLPAERIDPCEARFETLMLGLRMSEGVGEEAFFRMHGVTMDACYGERLRTLEKEGLLVCGDGRWRMTERGFDIQNSILVDLMD